jgi:hypothetical protein
VRVDPGIFCFCSLRDLHTHIFFLDRSL